MGDEQHTMEQPASDTQDMLVPRPMEDNGDGSANVLSGAPAPTPTVGAQSFSRGDDGAAHEVDKEELCISSRRLLQVVAFIGDGVAAASDELQQVLYISGQMLSFTEPSNNFSDLKNCCYRLRLVTANNLDEQPISKLHFINFIKKFCKCFMLYLLLHKVQYWNKMLNIQPHYYE